MAMTPPFALALCDWKISRHDSIIWISGIRNHWINMHNDCMIRFWWLIIVLTVQEICVSTWCNEADLMPTLFCTGEVISHMKYCHLPDLWYYYYGEQQFVSNIHDISEGIPVFEEIGYLMTWKCWMTLSHAITSQIYLPFCLQVTYLKGSSVLGIWWSVSGKQYFTLSSEIFK